MNIDNIAARFDNKPGFEVATYQEVFLPLYLLNVTTTVLEKKQITPLEEYELRVIDEGFNNATAIAGFLGIDRGLVVSSLSQLHRESVLQEDTTGVISLTSKGQEVLKELVSIRPKEHRYQFTFDAVTRNPRRVDTSNLYRPMETKDSGIRMIPGFPQRAPESEELDRNSLNSYFREANKSAADVQLLDVKRVNSPRRKFFEKAVMLVYKSEITDDVLVRFFINGRPQEAHDEAFQKNKGLERLGIDKESMDRNDVLDYLHQLGSKGEKIVSAVNA